MKYFIAFILLLNTSCVLANPTQSKFTVRVTDLETGLPVTNAMVRAIFTQKRDPWGTGKGKFNQVKWPVNQTGEVEISGYQGNSERGISGRAFAPGYYTEGKGFKFTGKNLVLNRWEPWNPTIEVKLRPKKNPVPMVYQSISREDIPAWDEAIGFDFEFGDWVAPHGKGKRKDILFHVLKKGYQGAECHMSFLNKMDGIQEFTIPQGLRSSYIFPYLAPTNGYLPKLFKEKWYANAQADAVTNTKEINYIFRVRTRVDEDGNIVSANYGRFKGEISISSHGRLYFSYWFNPDPQSRSLESLEKPY